MLAALQRRRGLLVGLQLAFLAVLLGFLGWALGDTWGDWRNRGARQIT